MIGKHSVDLALANPEDRFSRVETQDFLASRPICHQRRLRGSSASTHKVDMSMKAVATIKTSYPTR